MSKARELASLGNAYSDGALSNRNLIINGAMQVAQRGTSTTVGEYFLDRWKTVSPAPFPATQEAVTGLAGFSKCLRIQRPVGMAWNTAVELNQPVESINSVPVVGKTVTLSFWARVGSDYGGGVDAFTSSISYHNLTGTDMGMELNDFLATSYSTTVSQANTPSTDWTYYTMTADIASDAYQVGVTIATESWTGTAGANDYFEVTGVQLEVGDTATPFEHRSYGQELALCQRYYRHYQSDSSTYMPFFQGGTVNSTLFRATFPLSPPMRRQPSLLTTGVASNYQISGTTNANCTSVPYLDAQSEPDVLDIAAPHGAVTGGQAFFLRAASSTTAFIGLDAEL